MSFAQEVAAAKAAPEAPAPTQAEAFEATNDIMNVGINDAPADPAAPDVKSEPVVTDAKPPQSSAPIRIGTKEFTTPEAALQYATELEAARIAEEAFNRGVQAAKPPEAEVKAKSYIDEMAEELFSDPAKVIARIIEETEKKTKATIRQEDASKIEVENTWNSFYSQHTDLSQNQDIVKWITERDRAELSPLPVDQGLKIVAERARAVINKIRKDNVTETELPSGKSAVARSGGSPAPQIISTEQKPIDFIHQVNKHRKRG